MLFFGAGRGAEDCRGAEEAVLEDAGRFAGAGLEEASRKSEKASCEASRTSLDDLAAASVAFR